MDRLQELLNYQAAFQKQRKKFTGQNQSEELREVLLYAHEELTEILKALEYKPYQNSSNGKISNVKEELIDSLKYNLIMLNIVGMDSEQIVEEFYRKSRVVEQKWLQALDLKLEKNRVACIDIDGVLCDWMKTWVKFLVDEGLAGEEYLDNYNTLEVDASEIIIVPEMYSELKAEFRESGRKKDAYVYPESKPFLDRISKDYQIIIVSARPVKKHNRLYADTIEWLDKNGLKYDGIVFEEDKRSWALANHDKVAFCVEDDPEQAKKMSAVGIFTYLLDKPYNKGVSHKNIVRVNNLSEVLVE